MNATISLPKVFFTFLLSLTFLSLASAQVLALDIQVRPDGSVYFYQSQVLGDEDEAEKVEVNQREEKQEVKREEKRENQKPVKVLPSNEQNRIRLLPQKNKAEIQIEKKKRIETKTEESKETEFERKESMNADGIRIGVPAVRENENEVENELKDETEREVGDKLPEIERLRNERRERVEEEFEIQSETKDDGTTEFQFESRNVKAKFPAATEVLIDPTTRDVTILTPNGKEHVLQHLPDQAIDRMLEAGFATVSEDGTKSEVEVENTTDDRLVFTMTQKKTKRFLGFPIEVENKVSLDDETGEVSETEVPPSNPLLRVLNFFAR